MIRGITYNKQLFKSNDFALMTKRFFNNNDGKVNGCDISTSGNTITIAKGWFIASGYYNNISSQEIVEVSQSGVLVYEIDLSQINTEQSFNQGSFKIISGTPRQDDLFDDGTIYQMPIAELSTDGTTATIIETLWKDIQENNIQEQSFTISNNNGSATFTFKRCGNIVQVICKVILAAGKTNTFLYELISSNIPDFAKISEIPSASKTVVNGAWFQIQPVNSGDTSLRINEGSYFSIVKQGDGNYSVFANATQITAQSEDRSFYSMGTYIVN